MCIPGPIPPVAAQLFARDTLTRALLWLLHRATRQTLRALFRVHSSEAKLVRSERAAMLASIPGRIVPLDATLRALLGSARRRSGMKNDFIPFTAAPLERITCPTLIVHGRSDKTVPPASAEYAHAHIQRSELYWMDGSHFAFGLEALDTAPAYVLSWLRND